MLKGKKKKKKNVEEVDEEQLEETGKKGKKKKKKLLLLIPVAVLLVGAAVAVFFLRGRGGDGEKPEEEVKDDTVDPPQVYTLGESELLALPVLSETVIVHQPEVPEPAEGEDPITAVTYIYEGFTDARGLLAGYAGLLTAEDMGYAYVDEGLIRTEAPDFEEESGSFLLAKEGAEENTVHTIQLDWSPEQLGTVILDTTEGRIREPRAETMTLMEAEDYMRSMNPADLGLEGDTMASYRIYPLAGSVLVDGRPCLHMSVYSIDETAGTNQIAGEFFIASDKSHIYRRDSINGRVYEVGG